MAGQLKEDNSLVIGPTPEVYQQIGLSALPIVINQTHVDYAINGSKDANHSMGVEMLKKLPKLLRNPVAVIESATCSRDSVVAIVSAKVNGKQMIAAIEVGGISKMDGERYDANVISSVYGKKNAITKLLTEAIQKENAGNPSVYFLKKSEARSLYARSGVQFPGTAVQDGLIHSIFDAGAEVNREFMDQTETRQFKRWFGESKVVDEDGKPMVMYHGTRAEQQGQGKRRAWTESAGRRKLFHFQKADGERTVRESRHTGIPEHSSCLARSTWIEIVSFAMPLSSRLWYHGFALADSPRRCPYWPSLSPG